MPQPPENSGIIDRIYAELLPLKGTGEPYYTDPYGMGTPPDKVGPDDPIREVVSAVLRRLEVDGMHGCPLCCS